MNTIGNRKIVLVGTGFVGMSMAYSLLTQRGIDELVLIDVNKEKAEGEAMDLSHGLPYAANSKMIIKSGGYEECADASIIVITAGAAQKPGQTRLELTAINTKIIKEICENIKASGFNGVIIVASNPVDIMTYVVQQVTGLPTSQVFGSGTLLDTARLRYMIGNYLDVNPNNVHAYIMGEHGDSSFVSWTNAYIGSKSLLALLDEQDKGLDDLLEIYEEVRNAAYEIIEKKKATYYGIGLSLNRLVAAVLNNEDLILSVSAHQNGEYGKQGLYIGVPAVVNRDGIRDILVLPLNEVDRCKFEASYDNLEKVIKETVDPLL
ncbi:L-lactate dehydrogenase [Breznakia sp. PF5-3]|uniref:L-lactate dehydrogenase n=1 Tax=unclassified Breznakia TaxID=2623764 RepID=UPI0024073D9A|nr:MULTISPECIES: L-lactate dehydrogenase [unclassified Breznakia]MDL2276061.1 L-lactate dehydrogenase [Breznakia sp. OttesenSCG-928-G09]MDF9825510.1 L-lactate dehydrogenase [Breznakia sp. PM6-1]MDF9836368.1 L-lactate dehydrogenase [Breznakia sp. PF5-3]MDF9837484.1 L-lactate dehydrogenase [Breznakia sp. PFB2-8]MDF9859453.1 L-lactate dehydrogenase [Breznakia sp. PH5-24]